MGRFLLPVVLRIVLAGVLLAGMAHGQATQSENAMSSKGALTPSKDNDAQPPEEESSAALLDPASLLPDLPPLPRVKTSLIGGTIERVDRVRDRITVRIFGGGKIIIAFDPRTRIVHDGADAPVTDLHQGDRVYVDTILDGSTVFARTIQLQTSKPAGECQGIVTSYRIDKNELMIRDALSPQPLKVRIASHTRITDRGHPASGNELAPGTLVAVKFDAQQDGSDVAREVSVLAVPGASFTFAGLVAALDLRLGLLVLTSATDHKTYEIYLDPSAVAVDDRLRQGVDVTAVTKFDGSRYVAHSLTINSR